MSLTQFVPNLGHIVTDLKGHSADANQLSGICQIIALCSDNHFFSIATAVMPYE